MSITRNKNWLFSFVLLRLAIVLSVLRYTDSDYPFGIFKLFIYIDLLSNKRQKKFHLVRKL